MRTSKGFTLIETCLAFGISIIILNLVLAMTSLLRRFPDGSTQRQNFMGIIQLRQILSLGREFEVNGDGLCMDYQAEETCFHMVNGMLVQTPGTQAYLINLQYVEFLIEDQFLILNYTSQDHDYESVLIEVIN